MNYKLNEETKEQSASFLKVVREVNKFIGGYSRKVILMAIGAFLLILIVSAIGVVTPNLIGEASQEAIANRDKEALLRAVIGLLVLFVGSAIGSYFQILLMGNIGQEILGKLRVKIFEKLQSLPLSFFNENKSGDLISRINNDTDKLNQALSETLLRFLGNIFIIIGVAIAMLISNPTLGFLAVGIAVILLVITNLLSRFIEAINKKALTATGNLSGEIQESLSNFKVIIAFNRRDYFKNSFQKVNESSKQANIVAGIGNNILTPIYDFGGNIALFLVYYVGITLITSQVFTLFGIEFKSALEFGTLISYVLYVDRLYSPLRIMASLFSSIQLSLAAWSRISQLLRLESNLNIVSDETKSDSNSLMKFNDVSFGYTKEKLILQKVNLEIQRGKTYALVGPTGGGKSTTAALIARLYDPTEGEILLEDLNIKSYSAEELTKKIGFILQEPFLFSDTLKNNIIYGNDKYKDISNEELTKFLKDNGLERLLEKFSEGLETQIANGGENFSLGQKQLIAFLRVILREPELLILDEATANIDTVTESILQDIINKLPSTTTKIIIAHRLNTIENADQIFFIANGKISDPVSFNEAMKLINDTKRNS